MKLATDTKLIAMVALAGAGALWWITRQGTAANLASGAVQAVGGAAVGVVKGVGSLVGIPDTNQTQCDRDLAAGNYWDASFSCPAGRFISSSVGAAKDAVFGSTTLSAAAAAEARREFAATDPRRVDLPQTNYDPLVNDQGMDFRYF